MNLRILMLPGIKMLINRLILVQSLPKSKALEILIVLMYVYNNTILQ